MHFISSGLDARRQTSTGTVSGEVCSGLEAGVCFGASKLRQPDVISVVCLDFGAQAWNFESIPMPAIGFVDCLCYFLFS